LEAYGVKFENVIQANDRIFARRTFTNADYALLVTTAYGPHPAANSVRRAPDQFPLLLLTAGALRKGQELPHLQVREVVKAMPGTWGDRDGIRLHSRWAWVPRSARSLLARPRSRRLPRPRNCSSSRMPTWPRIC
jgi:hypothetical protein